MPVRCDRFPPAFITIVSILMTLAAGTAASAQSAPPPETATPAGPTDPCGSLLSIVTRPTVTTSTCNVRAGHALAETGYTNATITGAGGGGGESVSYPATLLRIGLSQHADLEITPPSYDRSSAGGTLLSGSTDAGVGAKWELGYTNKAVWGVSTQVSAPSGTPAFSAGRPQYTVNANWGYTLNAEFSLNGTFSFNSLAGYTTSGQNQRYSAVIPSVYLAAALPGNAQVYAEYAYFSSAGPGLGPKNVLDFAYQRDLGAHVQLDVEYGFQPNLVNNQRQHYVGAGFSFMN